MLTLTGSAGINVIQGMFGAIKEIIVEFVSLLTDIFQNVINLFYTPATEGAEGGITVLGTFLLIGLGTGLVIWAFNFIRGLIRLHRA